MERDRPPRAFYAVTGACRLVSWAVQLPIVLFAIAAGGPRAWPECRCDAGSYETQLGDPRCVQCAAPVSR